MFRGKKEIWINWGKRREQPSIIHIHKLNKTYLHVYVLLLGVSFHYVFLSWWHAVTCRAAMYALLGDSLAKSSFIKVCEFWYGKVKFSVFYSYIQNCASLSLSQLCCTDHRLFLSHASFSLLLSELPQCLSSRRLFLSFPSFPRCRFLPRPFSNRLCWFSSGLVDGQFVSDRTAPD